MGVYKRGCRSPETDRDHPGACGGGPDRRRSRGTGGDRAQARGLRLWEAAVKEAGSLVQADVIRALDHAKIAEGPGGPVEMVPGQHHVRMNMYIAQARHGDFTSSRTWE